MFISRRSNGGDLKQFKPFKKFKSFKLLKLQRCFFGIFCESEV
jgi:hypothetical protein